MKISEHKKIPANGANIGGEHETEIDIINPETEKDYINSGAKTQVDIVSLIPQGIENAVSSAELMTALGIQSKRTLAKKISQLRESGAVILARKNGCGGYFLPDTGQKGRNEIIEWQRVSSATAVSTLRKTASASNALKISPQQIKMEEYNGTKENVQHICD